VAGPPVVFDGVSKRFRVYRQRHDSLKEVVLRRRRGVFNEFWALRDVSFAIEPGTTAGFIGANGSGKSTVLKLMARILHPNEGHLNVNGRVSALLELGTGFHPDYTGRENIFLNGALLGIRRDVIRRRMDDIIDFAGLAPFIDNPVKTYSTGMYMRLGFAIAVNVEPDVLLIDEVLAVGDADFEQKCFDRINVFREQRKTIVLVSHDLAAVRRFCDRAILLDQGRIRADGAPDQVIKQYLSDVKHRQERPAQLGDELSTSRWGTREIEIGSAELLDGRGQPQYVFKSGEPLQVSITYRCKDEVRDPVFGVAIFRSDGLHCYASNTRYAGVRFESLQGDGNVMFTIPQLNLLEGSYLLTVAITDQTDSKTYDRWDRRIEFRVRPDPYSAGGLVFMPGRWRPPSAELHEESAS
jgi:ABC-type polysaccharide/polyol phosphate transport system ATPase subunit